MKRRKSSPAKELVAAVRAALRDWHATEPVEDALCQLYIYRKLCRTQKISGRLALNALLLQAIDKLAEIDEQAARLLRKRYLDSWSVTQIAHQLNNAESTVFVLQRQATERLAAVIQADEAASYAEQQAFMLQQLDLTNLDHLVGIEGPLAELLPLFQQTQPPWLIALEGLGGLGKTTLASALLHRLIEQRSLDAIGWVCARQQRFSPNGELYQEHNPALTAEQLIEALVKQLLPGFVHSSPQQRLRFLQAHLRETPHVIVVDNLETLTDIEVLLPTLQQLANPTRFLLTSRESYFGEQMAYHYRMRELEVTEALQLIRQEACWSSLPILATAPDEELLPIYTTVGGNPLALRLVVGQSHLYPLGSILADLRAARSQMAEQFYTYIYWRAWEKLDELHRRALLVMPLAPPEGEELDYLAAVGNLEVDEMRMALNRLVTLNLVNSRGGLNERRYAIHSLTRTFLVTQVSKWLDPLAS